MKCVCIAQYIVIVMCIKMCTDCMREFRQCLIKSSLLVFKICNVMSTLFKAVYTMSIVLIWYVHMTHMTYYVLDISCARITFLASCKSNPF